MSTATTRVIDIINRAKNILHEVTRDGTRWTNSELMVWLNESYQAIVQVDPSACSKTEWVDLKPGTRQRIPLGGTRLLEVVRNVAPASRAEGVLIASRKQLDTTRRGWHREERTIDIEQYVFDPMNPVEYYVYPPAAEGTKLEIIFSYVPSQHSIEGMSAYGECIRIPDSYAPVMVDYILYRAYSKDADHAVNLNRATMHQGSFFNALGTKIQAENSTSPNQGLPQDQPRAR